MGGALGCIGHVSGTMPEPSISPAFRSKDTNAVEVAEGQQVHYRMCYEVADDLCWRWEEAFVSNITGKVITVSVTGSGNKSEDIVIDCGTDDLFNLATRDMLSLPKQIESGIALSEDQRERCCSYFDLTHGIKDTAMPQRHEHLPARGDDRNDMMTSPVLAATGPAWSLVDKRLMCRDRFKSKHSGNTVYKWRNAEIVDVQDTSLKIHFTGWSHNHDIWKDLKTTEIFDLAPPDGVDRDQAAVGGPLTETQKIITLKYLRDGIAAQGAAGHSSHSSARLHHSYVAGQQVDVQETHTSLDKKTRVLGKWRSAVIKKVRGDVIKIQYLAVDSSYDEEIDLGIENSRVMPFGTMTAGSMAAEGAAPSLGASGAIDSPEQRRRKGSRRASFDPSQLESYSRDSNRLIGGAEMGSSSVKKYRVHVDPTSAAAHNRGYSIGSLDDLPAPNTQEPLNNYNGPAHNKFDDIESSELDASAAAGSDSASSSLAAWNAPTKSSRDRRGKASGKSSHQRTLTFPDPENNTIAIENYFYRAMAQCGYHVIEVEGDGNCLFRAVAHQLWLDESRHGELRQACVKHMTLHRKRYEVFCPMDFGEYLSHMSVQGTWADDFEIRALEEMLDRLISIYSSDNKDIKPINKNFDEEQKLGRHVRPVILSYHGGNHYNSVFDERSPLPLGLRNTHVILDLRTVGHK